MKCGTQFLLSLHRNESLGRLSSLCYHHHYHLVFLFFIFLLTSFLSLAWLVAVVATARLFIWSFLFACFLGGGSPNVYDDDCLPSVFHVSVFLCVCDNGLALHFGCSLLVPMRSKSLRFA